MVVQRHAKFSSIFLQLFFMPQPDKSSSLIGLFTLVFLISSGLRNIYRILTEVYNYPRLCCPLFSLRHCLIKVKCSSKIAFYILIQNQFSFFTLFSAPVKLHFASKFARLEISWSEKNAGILLLGEHFCYKTK